MKACVVCKSKNFKKLFTVNGHSLVRCKKCGLVKTKQSGEVGHESYHRDENYEKFNQHFENIFKKRYKIIERFRKTPGRILDIGASTGGLLKVFKDNGWETWGVEPSKKALKVAEKKGIKMIGKSFEKAGLPKDYFDVVILNHTLEHTRDPLKVLKKVNIFLKKRGIVYVDVPNFGSLSSEILGKRWQYLLPEEHIYQFTEATLKKVVEKSGFNVIWSSSWSGIFDYANPALEIWQSLIGLKKRLFYDIFGVPTALLSTLLNKGTSLAVIGKK